MYRFTSQSLLVMLACLVISGKVLAFEITGTAAKIHAEVLGQWPLYDDPALHEYANELAQRIADVTKDPNDEYRIFILDAEDVNAFTPGYGLIYFHRGLVSLMTTEGQFAAVIAHEIGHNVGNHISRGKRKQTIGNIGEFLASVLAGNAYVGSAMAIGNAEREKAFSRELELEADAYAAEFLYSAGYDPQEMISSLSILKDYSLLMDQISGTHLAQYHGVFTSHPTSDKRLKELVEQAGTLPPGEAKRGRYEMREAIEGIVFGPNFGANKRSDQERYTNKSLGITFVYPKDWSREIKGSKIVLKDAEKTMQLKISIEKTADKSKTSEELLLAKFPDDLSDVQKIGANKDQDNGTLGKRPQQRVGLINVGRNTFHFQGIARNNQLTDAQDAQFVEIISSFRRATRDDLSPEEVRRVTFKRLEPGETFASLAKSKRLGKYTEQYLRVMNGYYPKGEAEPGMYLKVIAEPEQEKDKTQDKPAE